MANALTHHVDVRRERAKTQAIDRRAGGPENVHTEYRGGCGEIDHAIQCSAHSDHIIIMGVFDRVPPGRGGPGLLSKRAKLPQKMSAGTSSRRILNARQRNAKP